MPLRVAVLSLYPLYRAGLAMLVNEQPRRATVVGAGASVEPLFDVALYDLSGLEGLHKDMLRELARKSAVVGLKRSMRPDLTETARLLGVGHFIDENADSAVVVDAVEQATGRQTHRYTHSDSTTPLTERELLALHLIARGLSNVEVAERMFLSPNTLKSYIRSAYAKIGAQTRSQAVLWTLHYGLASSADVPPLPRNRPVRHG